MSTPNSILITICIPIFNSLTLHIVRRALYVLYSCIVVDVYECNNYYRLFYFDAIQKKSTVKLHAKYQKGFMKIKKMLMMDLTREKFYACSQPVELY